jgi:soluble lytic murein transglycosylase-like protein
MLRLRQIWPLLWRLLALAAVVAIAAVVLLPGPRPPAKAIVPPKRIPIAQIKHKVAPPPKAPDAAPVPVGPSVFALEQTMSHAQLMKRWDDDIAKASKRFGVPVAWIRAVMQIESGGRTMLAEGLPITSSQGAMGLMQLMPETYDDMRRAYRLGGDPYAPHDNILAGTAYLKFLQGKYGYPQMFAAYNDGPGNLEQRLRDGGLLPEETRNYLGNITAKLEGRAATGSGSGTVTFTRPNGEAVEIVVASVTHVRAALPNEYAPGVLTVIKTGKMKQGVRESVSAVTSAIRGRGGAI